MSNFSLTYGSFIAFILMGFLKKADLPINESDITTTIETVVQIITAIGVFWGRYRAGGVSPMGFRKSSA